MDRDRWARIEHLCSEALELTGPSRGAFVAQACEGDTALQDEVLSLLSQLDAEPTFLESPIAASTRATSPDDALHTAFIGPWRLVRLLGSGGMGDVHLATRDLDGVVQTVALKVIRMGMATDELLNRFRLERRILATLRHPNVAQLVDAGETQDGRPYFAMEYVEGTPLTEYCESRRLSLADRLRLFQVICGAVQHAHQHLVVHRDLKPRNILVTDEGVPKLLDFGIGKVLGDSAQLGVAFETNAELRLLTPEYAAPEQLLGTGVTTATDVYALGVMLYESLAGQHPYGHTARSRTEIERLILDSAPQRPSLAWEGASPERRDAALSRASKPESLRRHLAGDLDTIVLMALRKEPERRYPSAAALAEDLRCYLHGLPVAARPDTLGYRARKFVARNAGGVAAGATLIVALLAIAWVSVVQSRRVAAEAARTAEERDKALEVRGFLMEMFGASGAAARVGDTITARSLLDRQRSQLDVAFRGRASARTDMLEVLADGYDRLGLYADAEPLAREALSLRRQLLPAGHSDIAAAASLLGWIIYERGRNAEAESLITEAIRLRRAAGTRQRDGLSRSLNDLGVLYNGSNRAADAISPLREALVIRRSLFGDQHRAVGITANNLAAALYYQKQLDSAISVQDLALRALQASVGPEHQRTVVALSNLAAFKRAKGDLPGAEADYRALAERQTKLQGKDHPVTARVLTSLATVLTDRGTLEHSDTLLVEAEALHRQALGALEARLGPTHPQLATILDRLGRLVGQRGRPGEAATLLDRALTIQRAASGDTSSQTRQAAERAAAMYRTAGDAARAARIQREFRLR